MGESVIQPANNSQDLTKVRPTLFIGVGGTGMEISLRVRRRLLNYIWGDAETPVRLASLTEFPLAQFINFDLAVDATTESGRSAKTDPLAKLVQFTDEEKLIFPLDLNKFIRSEGELNSYPHIASWFPLTPGKVKALGIDPSQGAAQIRSLSRLYFFDKYQPTKRAIEEKISLLLAGVSSKEKTERLHLELEPASLRVVVIASTAGGTGAGSFLDMGYLASRLAKKLLPKARVDLCLMLPSGYSGVGKSRTEANAYAALMELESCTGRGLQFVKEWEKNEVLDDLPLKPYDEVFFFDTGNLALKKTKEATDVFDMVADILFEDFTSAEFAGWKRQITVNQSKFKIEPFAPDVDAKYGSMKLIYSKAYSSFGQSIIDTQLEQKRDEVVCSQVNAMLKIFFGLASDTEDGFAVPPPTPEEARNLLKEHVYCTNQMFTVGYDFNSDATPYKKGLEYRYIQMVDQLLFDGDRPLLGALHEKINKGIDDILASSEKDQRLPLVDKLLNQINRDIGLEGGATDAGASGLVQAIEARSQMVFNLLKDEKSTLLKALWAAVDNKEKGGLDYTIQLIEQVKDAIENDATGLLRDLESAQQWFSGLCAKLQGSELQVIREHIGQARGKGLFGLGGNKEAYAEAKLQQLGEAVRWYTEAHLRAVACDKSAELLRDFSVWLGEHKGIDQKTNRKRWSQASFAGKLGGYERLVGEIMAGMNEEILRTQEASKKGHAAYQVVKVATKDLETARRLDPQRAMEWARSVFDNIGGSRIIFQKLEDETTRSELLGQLRNISLSRLPSTGTGDNNPLIQALRDMDSTGRRPLFQNCLDMAMPWVEANLEGKWKVDSDQYYCIVGVKDAKLFDKEFGDEFRAALPACTRMGAGKIKFYETGLSGKLTCYVELSGIPITAFTLLSSWRASYNDESKKIPVHTHKDKTLFVHPMAPSATVLDRLAADFKIYILGIILGALKERKTESTGRVYCLNLFGESLSIGNERTIRMEGIAPDYLGPLKDKLRDARGKITSIMQYAGFAALLDFYASSVYPPAKIQHDDHVDVLLDGFCRVLCQDLHNEELQKLHKKAAAIQGDTTEMIGVLKDNMSLWTDEIEGSESDADSAEVGSSHGPKRILKLEFFQPGWLEEKFGTRESLPANGRSTTSGSLPPGQTAACRHCEGKIQGQPNFCPHCGKGDWQEKPSADSICPHCGTQTGENAKFCPGCGKQIGAVCPNPGCGYQYTGSLKFCPQCGTPLGGALKPANCTKCGSPLQAGTKFCSDCGEPAQ
jgi:hypothetical protein